MRANLLTRIEAWLESPTGQDETAELFMDIATAIEAGLPIDPAAPVAALPVRLQQVLAVIQERPGISSKDLAATLTIRQSNVLTVTSRLRQQGLIRSEQCRQTSRFFALTEESPATVSPATLHVDLGSLLAAIQARPGITAKELVAVFGQRSGTLYTAICRLRDASLIRSEQGHAYPPFSAHYYPLDVPLTADALAVLRTARRSSTVAEIMQRLDIHHGISLPQSAVETALESLIDLGYIKPLDSDATRYKQMPIGRLAVRAILSQRGES